MSRLEQQLSLLIELDQLKSVLRRTRVKSAEGRLENSAEHSWHVALMAILMEEHANEPVDIARVVKMLLLHDIVEIDAGDTFVYDTAASKVQKKKNLKQQSGCLVCFLMIKEKHCLSYGLSLKLHNRRMLSLQKRWIV